MNYSKETILYQLNHGVEMNFITFWKGDKGNGKVGHEVFSQWYPSRIEFKGIVFPTAEHWMMYQKAILFEDIESASKVLSSQNPFTAKRIGKAVKDFDETIWAENRQMIVANGNYLKFTQNKKLLKILLDSYPSVLVEASPYDFIWGAGLSYEDERISKPEDWPGLNLLGFTVMQVRDLLISISKTNV
jgi:ribA/ribD-fused uncharacterized protein